VHQVGRRYLDRIRILAVQPNTEDVDFMKELIEAGKVTPVIDRTYLLSKVPGDIGYVAEGDARGKVVITV
jgi:NADPH:quinone reductase-like Zn-dependent oxidoreductase